MKRNHQISFKSNPVIKVPLFFRHNFGMKQSISITRILIYSAFIFASIFFGHSIVNNSDDLLVKFYEKIDLPIKKIAELYRAQLNHFNMVEKLHQLQEENKLMKLDKDYMEFLIAENKELKSLNNYVSNLNMAYITTRAVGSYVDDYGLKMIVNIGSLNGALEGQPVVSKEGIVGRLIKVQQQSANILLVSDAMSKIPVLLLESGLRCIAAGNGNNQYLEIKYLENSKQPKIGELVVTSGDGGFIPFGLNIGKIAEAEDTGKLRIKLSSDLSNISLVSVIKNHNDILSQQ